MYDKSLAKSDESRLVMVVAGKSRMDEGQDSGKKNIHCCGESELVNEVGFV